MFAAWNASVSATRCRFHSIPGGSENATCCVSVTDAAEVYLAESLLQDAYVAGVLADSRARVDALRCRLFGNTVGLVLMGSASSRVRVCVFDYCFGSPLVARGGSSPPERRPQ